MTADKAISIKHPSPLPPDLSKPNAELDAYLSSLKEESEASQRRTLRYAKMAKTRSQNALKNEESKRAVICKQDVKEPGEGELVVETIKGVCVVCDHCMHKWIHHSNNLGRQYYCQCPHCRRNVRLHKRIRG